MTAILPTSSIAHSPCSFQRTEAIQARKFKILHMESSRGYILIFRESAEKKPNSFKKIATSNILLICLYFIWGCAIGWTNREPKVSDVVAKTSSRVHLLFNHSFSGIRIHSFQHENLLVGFRYCFRLDNFWFVWIYFSNIPRKCVYWIGFRLYFLT